MFSFLFPLFFLMHFSERWRLYDDGYGVFTANPIAFLTPELCVVSEMEMACNNGTIVALIFGVFQFHSYNHSFNQPQSAIYFLLIFSS